ncbi:MAG TPA: hypothetical protein GX731_02330 [Clostridiales bacterium]|nr:hypothetical protein [Clostridiales bacterium]
MIHWSPKLYVGDKLKSKLDKTIKSIDNRKVTYGVFCITFASNRDNLFDILNANELRFPYYQRSDIYIVGLTKGREEALVMVQDLLIEVYQNTGEFKVREYFT